MRLPINVAYTNCLISGCLKFKSPLIVAPEFLTFIDVFADIIMKISFTQLYDHPVWEIVSISCRPVCMVHCK